MFTLENGWCDKGGGQGGPRSCAHRIKLHDEVDKTWFETQLFATEILFYAPRRVTALNLNMETGKTNGSQPQPHI